MDVPFPSGTTVHVKTYAGHNPDDKKMDLYADGWPAVVAPLAGTVVKTFGCNPGSGFQVYHGNGLHTVYCHVASAPAVGARFAAGQVMARVGDFAGMAKHLHWEQLRSDGAVADTNNMIYPNIQGRVYRLVPGEPGLTFVAGRGSTGRDDLDMATEAEVKAWFREVLNEGADTSVSASWAGTNKVMLAREKLSNDRLASVLTAIGALDTADEIAAKVVAKLPPSSGGAGATKADVIAAVRAVFADAGTP